MRSYADFICRMLFCESEEQGDIKSTLFRYVVFCTCSFKSCNCILQNCRMSYILFNKSCSAVQKEKNKVNRYDLDGNFIGKVRGGYGMNLAVDSEGNCYKTNRCSKEQPNRLLMVNDEDSVSYVCIKNDYLVMVNHYSFTNEFDCHNDKVYYSYPCCDTIFDVTNGKQTPVYYIDYNGKNLPVDEVFSKGRSFNESSKIKFRYSDCFSTDIFRIADDFLYIGSVNGEKLGAMSLYSFKTGKVLSACRLIDDIFFPDNAFKFKPHRMPIAVEDNSLLWFVSPSWLLQGYEYYKEKLTSKEWKAYCKRYPQIIELCSKLDEESNPVLFKMKIKDF